jgi:hypothetical protein
LFLAGSTVYNCPTAGWAAVERFLVLLSRIVAADSSGRFLHHRTVLTVELSRLLWRDELDNLAASVCGVAIEDTLNICARKGVGRRGVLGGRRSWRYNIERWIRMLVTWPGRIWSQSSEAISAWWPLHGRRRPR